MQGFAVCSI